MAFRYKTQVGTIGCLCCTHEVPVKAGENGTLNLACPWCDFPAYAKAGTEAHRIISAKMKPTVEPAPAPAPVPAKPAPPAPPAGKTKTTIFG